MYIHAQRNKGFGNAVKKWMRSVDALEVNIEGHEVSVLMRKNHTDHNIYIEGWLNGEIPTERFKEYCSSCYWWVQYPLDVFKQEVFNV